jgi:oligoribonuclease NrnB/cAMP/cGMP phosphodiesterase (DHH superfamily)
VVKSLPNHVFDSARSGATIAWDYFHSGTKAPLLFQILEDEDLWQFKLPETRPIGVYLWSKEFSFETWDALLTDLEDPAKKAEILRTAEAYLAYFNQMTDLSVDHAHPIHFEGHTVLFANSMPMKTLKSAIGNALVKKMPPFALVVSVHPKGLGVSIRGDGSIDVSAIARKYGGNGHPNSAGFHIPWQDPMPFTSAEDHEDSRD